MGGDLLRPTKTIDWRPHYKRVLQRKQSCTGFGRSQAIRVFLATHGAAEPPFPDPYRNYYYSRRLIRLHELDEGSLIRTAFTAGRKFGDKIDWHYDWTRDDPIFKAPADFVDLSVDLGATGVPIYATGDDLVWRICDSLMRVQTCVIGLPWANSLLDPTGPTVIDVPKDELSGGHAVAVIGCIPQPIGPPNIIIGNSHGDWRENGTAVLTARFAGMAFDAHYLREVKWGGTVYS